MSLNFHYQNKRLHCEQTNLVTFSEQCETPYYLYSKKEISENCQVILDAAGDQDFLPCYALKANYNPHLLAIIRDYGFGADVVSGGELQFALKLGFPTEKIVFAGVGKTKAEIEFAIETGIHSLNIESAEELQLTAMIAASLKQKTRIALRVNPDIEAETHKYISTGRHINKFGIPAEEAIKLFKIAHTHPWLEPEGIHVHIGSQITKSDPFMHTTTFLKKFATQLKSGGIPIKYLDLGGGIGIDYQNSFQNHTAQQNYIRQILPDYLAGLKISGLKLVAELGRSVIGSAGILVSRVLYRKQTPLKKFLIVDAAMNNLIRPSLYSAHHEINPLELKSTDTETVDVVGPVCESSDFFAKDRVLQTMQQNDLIAVAAAGAYGQALASNYNLRPSIKEYLVDGSQVQTIYQGRSIDTLFKEYDFDHGTD